MPHSGSGSKPVGVFPTAVRLGSLVVLSKLIIWLACVPGTHDRSWISAFHKWDSYWYERIADQGYDPAILLDGATQSSFAFFPAYTMLARSVSSIFSISLPWAMEVLSFPIAFFCLWGAWALFALNGIDPRKGTVHFLLWPFSLFLFVHYSDALFIALLLWALVGLHRRQDLLAAACLTLLAVTRPNGIFFIPVVVLFIAVQDGHRKSMLPVDVAVWRRTLRVLTGPILSFAAWCALLWRQTGDPFAFNTAQTGWGRKLSWPWEGFFASGDLATQFESWYTLALIAATLWYWQRLTVPYRLWLALGILGPLLSGSVDSMTRFALSFFPLIMLVSLDLERSKRPYPAYAVLIGLQFFCLGLWALYHPLMA